MASGERPLSAQIIRTYYVITGLFNLAMSLIWGIDTLFKMGAGLDIQHVLLTNAAFTLGSMVFEIPTGVVADTVGRLPLPVMESLGLGNVLPLPGVRPSLKPASPKATPATGCGPTGSCRPCVVPAWARRCPSPTPHL